MANIKCYVSAAEPEQKKLREYAKKHKIVLPNPLKFKFNEEPEKKLAGYISYEIRYYHPTEKKYVTKRFGTGIESRRVAEAEKGKVESLIKTKTLDKLEQDYPLNLMFKDYEDKANINHSEGTKNRYNRIIKHFKRFFAERKPPIRTVLQLNTTVIEDYRDMRFKDIISNTERHPTMKTVRNEVNLLQVLVKVLYEKEKLSKNPLVKLKYKNILSLKGEKKKVQVLSEEELEAMLIYCKKSKLTNWFYYCLEFVKYTGARESDLINLQWKDIDFKKGIIHFWEKDKIEYVNSRGEKKTVNYRPKSTGVEIREEEFPIHPFLKTMLLELKENSKGPNDFIFKNSRHVRIPEGGLRKMTASTVKAINPDSKVTSFHSLRHFFADKVFAASKGDGHGIKLAMRHKHLATSGIYIDHSNNKKLKGVIDNIQYGGLTEEKEDAEVNEKENQTGPQENTDKKASSTITPTTIHNEKVLDTNNLMIYILHGQPKPGFANACPSCNGEWKDKVRNPKCGNCNLLLRKDLKIQVLENKCLYCLNGTIGDDKYCGECGQFHDDGLCVFN